MARAGEEIYNPIIQDRVVFLKTARDTDGALLRAELFLAPHGGNPMHVHPHQEEHFKVLSGTFGVQVGEEQRSLAEGEEALVPPNTPHRFFNDTDEEAHVLTELRPALNSEIWLETLYGLARDGKTDENGVPNLLQIAVTVTGINKDEIYPMSPPIPVQKVLLPVLAPVGRALGYKDHSPKYSAAEDPEAGESGPPSTMRVMVGGGAMVASLLVASLFLVGRVRRLSKG
jgi:quercetin dioxygenase-like cupin family protein